MTQGEASLFLTISSCYVTSAPLSLESRSVLSLPHPGLQPQHNDDDHALQPDLGPHLFNGVASVSQLVQDFPSFSPEIPAQSQVKGAGSQHPVLNMLTGAPEAGTGARWMERLSALQVGR